jgi:hypothetical protein
MLVSCFALAQMPGDYVIATGQLQGANFLHRAQGEVKIVKMNQGIFLSLDQNFSVTRGPDLFLMLRNTKNDKAGMPILATLKQYSGSQMFKLEISERDLMKFDQIIIYCKRFSSLFAFSELNFN